MTVYRALTSAGPGVAGSWSGPSFAEGAFMRFNPPPNWPQMPEGWTPPVGWKPDPSWPKPPSGWPLWVADDEFVISPYRAGASGAQPTPPWYRQTAYIVLLLIFFFPLGLVLLWLRNDWPAWARGIVTGVVGIFALIVIAGIAAGPPTPTALSSTGAVGTSASPQAVASSRSASPSPVVTTPAAPVTSAAPKTTAPAPAPVHTSAAPVYVPPAPAPTTQGGSAAAARANDRAGAAKLLPAHEWRQLLQAWRVLPQGRPQHERDRRRGRRDHL